MQSLNKAFIRSSSKTCFMKTTRLFIAFLLLFSLFSGFSQPAAFFPRGVGGGGALFFPTVNPANDNEFYISCDMSQLFHSTDFGNSYEQLHFNSLQVFNRSAYEFTNNPDIAYSIYNDGNDGFPVKTVNGGQSWLPLPGYDVGQYEAAYKLMANYDNPNQLLINTYGDILFSNNGGLSFSLVKHTVNNGAGLVMGGVFWDGINIYIGTNEGLIVSTNGGASFSVKPTSGIPASQVIWSFAGAKTGAATRFVCIAADQSDVYNGIAPYEYYGFAKGVFVMDNADGAWASKSAGINFSNDFIMYAAMARNNTAVIYLGGNDNALGAPLVLKSADGGNHWTKVFKSENNDNIATGWSGHQGDKSWGWGETCFGVTVAPNNANKVMFGDFGFVHVSSDGGASWKQAYVNNNDQHAAGNPTPKKKNYHSIGLENTTCWQIHWIDANTMMACFSDIGGIRSADGGQTWGFNYNGFSVNSVYRMVRTHNGNLYAACSNVHDLYQSTYLTDARLDVNDSNGKIVFSTDNGLNWSTLKSFGHPVFWLATDPNNASRMYASVVHFGGTQGTQQGGIYMTNNLNDGASSTWTKLPNPPRTEGHPASIVVLNDGKAVCTFSGRRTGSGFTASSGVFLYNPANNTWADVSDPGMHYWTKDLIIDPADPAQNTWYACVFSGWGGAPNGKGGLYLTTNRGGSWTKLTGTQFDRVTSLTFHPQKPNQAYLTTETQGLWLSNNMNTAVPDWQLVGAYPFRQPERVYFNPFNANEMWVSSFGNGMKVGNLSPTGTADFAGAAPDISLSPNPASDAVTVVFEARKSQTVKIQFTAMDGQLHSREYAVKKGQNRIRVPLQSLPDGGYVVTIFTDGIVLAERLMVQRE